MRPNAIDPFFTQACDRTRTALHAWNQRDIDRWVACYAPDVRYFTHAGSDVDGLSAVETLVGRHALRDYFSRRLKAGQHKPRWLIDVLVSHSGYAVYYGQQAGGFLLETMTLNESGEVTRVETFAGISDHVLNSINASAA